LQARRLLVLSIAAIAIAAVYVLSRIGVWHRRFDVAMHDGFGVLADAGASDCGAPRHPSSN
jgi:hypothetical protein